MSLFGSSSLPWCITLDNSKGISRLRFWAKKRRVNGINDLPVFMHQGTLLARLWCHLPLQNPANRAENLTRLCSAAIGQTGWRMVQFGAIRSRLETMKNRELTGNSGYFEPDRTIFNVVTICI